MNDFPTVKPLSLAAPPLLTFASSPTGLSDDSRLALLDYWRAITRHRWAIVGLALALGALAAVIAYSLPRVYQSTATVLIEAGTTKILSIEEIYGAAGQNREHFQTQAELLKSRDVAYRTIVATQLWEDPEFDPRLRDQGLFGKLKAAISLVDEEQPDWSNKDVLADATVASFRKALTVEPVRMSQLVKVSFEARRPDLAARVANATVKAYIDGDREARFELTRKVNNELLERAAELRTKLDASEAALQAYRDQKGIVSLNGSAQGGAALQVNEITQKLASARVRRTELESAYQQIKNISNGDYSAVPAVIGNASIADARAKVAELNSKVQELSNLYGATHPRMIEAQTSLSSARDHLQRQVNAVVAGTTNEYLAARNTEQSLQAALNMARGSVRDVNREESQLNVLEREVQSNKQLFELFMGRAKETSSASDLQTPVARIADTATPVRTPVSPKKAPIIALGLMLGLFAGALGSLLLDRLDNTLKGSDDTEQQLHQPVLTALPALESRPQRNLARLFIDEPQSPHSEAIRTARTGVLLSNLDLTHRTILVTSSVPGEGKTTACANLALAHAQTKRTILIDADMRRPQVGIRLGLPAHAKGLSNLVAGTALLRDCLHPIAGSSLMVIPAGNVPPNPLELLLSQRFRDVWETLVEAADIIIVDSPPVELVSDALVIAPLVTSTVYVVKAMETPYPLARKGIMRLQRAGANVLGVILNQLDFQRAQQYYGEVSAQYGYGSYGYSATEETPLPARAIRAEPVSTTI